MENEHPHRQSAFPTPLQLKLHWVASSFQKNIGRVSLETGFLSWSNHTLNGELV